MPIYKMNGRKDGKQKYRVRINYVDNTGKSRQIDRVAYGLEDAKDLERQLTLNLREETTPKMTLQQLYDEYIQVKIHEVRESTIAQVESLMRLYVLPVLGGHRIDKLTMRDLQKWKDFVSDQKTSKGDNLSLKYKKNIYSVFRAVLNYAIKMEYIDKNLLSTLGPFKDVTAIKKEMDYYTADEFAKFIEEARESAQMSERMTDNIYEWNFYVFFMIAFYTGMRKGEINALKWTDIDGSLIHVTRSVTQRLTGGDRETPPKNKSSVRTLQMPEPLMAALDEHLARYKHIDGFSTDWRICGGQRCLRDCAISTRNKNYAAAAGLKVIRIHDYRHSHASLLANNGINIQEIARRLGHANVEMTWNTYSHLYPQEEERAVQILNKAVQNRVKNVYGFK